MKKTILKSIADHADRESRIASDTATEEDRIQNDKLNKLGIMEWLELYHSMNFPYSWVYTYIGGFITNLQKGTIKVCWRLIQKGNFYGIINGL